MSIPRGSEVRYSRFLAGVAAAERLPATDLDTEFRTWAAPVLLFVMERFEREGLTGFQGAHRLLDLLGNLQCRLDGISWLANGTHVGVRVRRRDEQRYDLILPGTSLDLDRAALARLLKSRLSLTARTRVVTPVRPGGLPGKAKRRASGRTTARPEPPPATT